MNNMDLIRAKNALEASGTIRAGENETDTVKKIPPYIINNGLLATALFANEKKAGYENVFKAVVRHLKSIHRLPQGTEESSMGLVRYLVGKTSAELRDVTTETMAYLNYLRRFASKGD